MPLIIAHSTTPWPFDKLRTGLVKKLKKEGYWVRGVDIKEHEFAPTAADEFLLLDLREPKNCEAALSLEVWGDGMAIRSYTYVSDMVDGTRINVDYTDVHR